jgi:DNA polymerase III subunit alpha
MDTLNIPFLRTQSYFSLLESLMSPKDLVEKAAEDGIQTLGLTDHNYLSGALDFYEACRQDNIKPILGLEIDLTYHSRQGRLVLFAKDRIGWSNLCRLSSKLLIENHAIELETLSAHREGLLCIAGGHRGILRELILSTPTKTKVPQHFLDHLKMIFVENCYMEIQRFITGPLKNELALLGFAQQFELPLIASQTIYYGAPKDQHLHKTITAIRHNVQISQLLDWQLPPDQAYFPKKTDFAHRYHDLPEALTNLQLIVEQFNLELPIGKINFPNFPTPNGLTQSQFLRERAYAGAKKIYKELTPQILDRLEHELSIIAGMGYEPIFLIMEDVLNQARQLGIPTSSRGSAASSLVAHCLRITSPDPLAHNLYFERFLNPARKKPPDIDTDIASHRREEIIQYVFDTYHPDRVAMVGTINRYRPKSALGDVAKAYGLSPETIRQLAKRLPSSFGFRSNSDQSDPFAPLLRDSSIPIIEDIVKDARSILDNPRHLSVHPGGIIIAPFPINDLIPIMHSPSLGINHAQYDLAGVEKLGMVKIDLLGIRGLTVLGEVADQIQTWHQSEYKNGLQVLDQIPKTDPDTATTVSSANTIGCFQIESPGMRATLREIHAGSVEDIMAALALYRPGPLRGGLRDAFVRRFRGEENVTHIHESLRHLLSDTLGVILYQEQVLRIANELGGLTIAQADILRRAMSHFDPGDVMKTLQNIFITGASQKHNIPVETAERIWDMMAAFAGYGFPKAHAASYAQLAWNSAWCKTHYPAEFMCAVLGYGGGYYSQRVYLMEARRLGLVVKPPYVNHACERFRVAYPNGQSILYMGLNQVRDLTQKTIRATIDNRPYQSVEDYLIRVDPHRKEARHLMMCGAFDDLTSIPDALKHLDHQRLPGQMTLFSNSTASEDWNVEQKSQAQLEILGVSLVMSPLEQFSDQIQSAGAVSTLEVENLVGQKITVAGMHQAFRRFRNRSNEIMAHLTLEDFDGSISILIPPGLYRKHHRAFQKPGPFLIEGIVEDDDKRDRTKMIAINIHLLQ